MEQLLISYISLKDERKRIIPLDSASHKKVHSITQQLHQEANCQAMGWYNVYLLEQNGDSQFRCFNICQDVCFTLSHYRGNEPFFSQASYPCDITLMVFGLKGSSDFGLSDTEVSHSVCAGNIWLFNLKGQSLHRYSAPNLHHEMAVIKFPTQRLKQAFSSSDHQLMSILDKKVSHIATQQDNAAWLAPLIDNPLNTPFDRIKAESRVLALLAHWLLPLGQSVTTSDTKNKTKSCAAEKARDTLVTMLTNPPSLIALAKQVGMSHTCLSRDFKKKYGKTVFDWLRGYRLQLAKTYLQDKKQSITDIAHQCGFSSASHFTQTFRQHEGCTPVVYRTTYLTRNTKNNV